MNKVETFENRINEIMEDKHLNQTQLSKLTNIKRTSISSYCIGTAEPNAERILTLSLELGVDPLWLLGYDVSRNKNVGTRRDIDSMLNKMNEKQLETMEKISLAILEGN